MMTLPNRRQFNEETKSIIEELFSYYDSIDRDFGTRGEFENRYKKEIQNQLCSSEFYVELTVSGTVALYVILKSLELAAGDEILSPPITDPGAVTPILLNGQSLRLYDLNDDGMTTLSSIQKRVTSKTKVVIINHLSGVPIFEIEEICRWCREKNIFVIEDSSQAHGAKVNGKYAGTFGDAGFFSTMFSKNHSSGGAGAIILTANRKLYESLVLHIHKGKALYKDFFNEKDPSQFLLPALNLEMPEICSAIGIATLKNLKATNLKRNMFLNNLNQLFVESGSEWRIWNVGYDNAPYFGILTVPKKMLIEKAAVIASINKSGIKINGNYPYIVSEWPWIKPHLDEFVPVNALSFRNGTINLLFNENFGEEIAKKIFHELRNLELNFH